MRKGNWVRSLCLCLALCSLTTWTYRVSAAGPTTVAARNVSLDQMITAGVEYERGRQWLEAIEHYEKATKQWPEASEITYGLRRSKIHFSIERRYTDNSFLQRMLTLPRFEALTLVDELLSKVQDDYITPISSTSFAAHGTESLYLGLANPRFLQTNLPGVAPEKISRVRQALKTTYWNKPVDHRRGVFDVINAVCDMTEAELGLSSSAVVMEYLFGSCNALDEYSAYLTPTRYNDLTGSIEGQFVGIGIEMKAEANKGLLLVNVLPESPAAEGGLLSGEHIVAIEGKNCRTMTTDEAANYLQGKPGSRVTLDIEGRNNDVRQRSFQRRAVQVKSIPIVKMVDRENGVGYIKMTGFQKGTDWELDQALMQLQSQGMRSLIWDVRGNPGGLLDTAAKVLDRFLPEGVMVSTRGRSSRDNSTFSARRNGTTNLPLVLLIDGDSASASEIVAGAIRDHQRGTIVGRKSYGKWSVQSIFPLQSGAGLRLTTARFYSPNGGWYGGDGVKQPRGIAPDIEVAESSPHRTFFRAPTDVNIDEDLDLKKGIEVLRNGGRQLARP